MVLAALVESSGADSVMKCVHARQIYLYAMIFLATALTSNAHGQISLFYPDWYENPTFVVQNNYSASSCVAVQNNNLQSAKEQALEDTREEITNYLNGLPSDENEGSSIAARGVYLSNSQRVLDQDLGEEFFCVLGSLPYSRIEEAMKTGLTQSELEQALKDLAPALNLAAKGIITNPKEPLDFYTNALAYASINQTDAAYSAFTQLITEQPKYWDAHESFIQFAREFDLEAAAKRFYEDNLSGNTQNPSVRLAYQLLVKENPDGFTEATQVILLDHPECLICQTMLAAQFTWAYGNKTILTDSQKAVQLAAYEEMDKLGGVGALRSMFLKPENFRTLEQALEGDRAQLAQNSAIEQVYGMDKVVISTEEWDMYNNPMWQQQRHNPSYARTLPPFFKMKVQNLEEALEIRWRLVGHSDFVSTGAASSTLVREQEARMAATDQAAVAMFVARGLSQEQAESRYDQQKAAAAQYQPDMTQSYAMMDRAINYITNEPYIRPSTDLLAPKTLEPGEYIVELVYIDLRGVEVGPMSFTVVKSW